MASFLPGRRTRNTSHSGKTATSESPRTSRKNKSLRLRQRIFNFFYSSAYSFIMLLLLAALAVTPGDHIYQTVSNHRIGNVFVVGGVYLVTVLIATFIYASRLYTNRTALAVIPRSYLPIGKHELGRTLRRLVEGNWRRSALVAWEGRPRDLRGEVEVAAHRQREQALNTLRTEKHPVPFHNADGTTAEGAVEIQSDALDSGSEEKTAKLGRAGTGGTNQGSKVIMECIPAIDPEDPAWGEIAHPGWSSPSHDTMPALQFATVIAELPNLLEAQAVSLAPPDPSFDFLGMTEGAGIGMQGQVQPPPDPQVVALLQRERWMGIREYVGHLSDLGMLQTEPEDIIVGAAGLDEELETFLRWYEYARFSVEALSEAEFERLMSAFTGMLSRLVPYDGQPQQGRSRSSSSMSKAQSFSSVARRPVTPSNRSGSQVRSEKSSIVESTGSVVHNRRTSAGTGFDDRSWHTG